MAACHCFLIQKEENLPPHETRFLKPRNDGLISRSPSSYDTQFQVLEEDVRGDVTRDSAGRLEVQEPDGDAHGGCAEGGEPAAERAPDRAVHDRHLEA